MLATATGSCSLPHHHLAFAVAWRTLAGHSSKSNTQCRCTYLSAPSHTSLSSPHRSSALGVTYVVYSLGITSRCLATNPLSRSPPPPEDDNKGNMPVSSKRKGKRTPGSAIGSRFEAHLAGFTHSALQAAAQQLNRPFLDGHWQGRGANRHIIENQSYVCDYPSCPATNDGKPLK